MPGRGGARQANTTSSSFWSDAEKHEKQSKEQFRKTVFDDFDEFFDFKQDQREEGVTRDDTKGADYRTKVTITFDQAVQGADVEVEVNKRVVCNNCKGTRAEPGSNPRKCFECGGRGSYIGNYGIKKRCIKCNGAGCTPKTFCKSCEGLGV